MSILFRPQSRIYLDYASLTPVDPAVIREMRVYMSDRYSNPASLSREGVAARDALGRGREVIARSVGAHADEIVFTSGGTESNNCAIKGAVQAAISAGIAYPHIVISAIEHSSVIEIANVLKKNGCEVTIIGVDSSGVVSLDELKAALRPDTVLVSVMMVNNETGSIQPLREVVKIVRHIRVQSQSDHYPLVHTDASQALAYLDIDVEKLGVDLLTLDASKVYGPRGVGCLYVRRGTPIEPIIHGGGQERGLRSGTENLPGVMGLAKAVELLGTSADKEREFGRLMAIRHMMVDGLRAIRSDLVVNGDDAAVSPHILNVSIPGIDNEFFVLQLDAKGVSCSTKSSCLLVPDNDVKAHDTDGESYVLRAMNADGRTAVRFSFGRQTAIKDIAKTLAIIRTLFKRTKK